MKLITRDTDYALKALCYIAESKSEIVSVSELVKKLKIPKPFLRKILQTLNKEGLLKSYKGQGGGFQLACMPNDVLLVDIIKIFQGPFRLNECVFKKKKCHDIDSCLLKKEIDTIEDEVIYKMKSITLATLSRKKGDLYVKEKDYKDRREKMQRLWPVYPKLS